MTSGRCRDRRRAAAREATAAALGIRGCGGLLHQQQQLRDARFTRAVGTEQDNQGRQPNMRRIAACLEVGEPEPPDHATSAWHGDRAPKLSCTKGHPVGRASTRSTTGCEFASSARRSSTGHTSTSSMRGPAPAAHRACTPPRFSRPCVLRSRCKKVAAECSTSSAGTDASR